MSHVDRRTSYLVIDERDEGCSWTGTARLAAAGRRGGTGEILEDRIQVAAEVRAIVATSGTEEFAMSLPYPTPVCRGMGGQELQ